MYKGYLKQKLLQEMTLSFMQGFFYDYLKNCDKFFLGILFEEKSSIPVCVTLFEKIDDNIKKELKRYDFRECEFIDDFLRMITDFRTLVCSIASELGYL